MSFSTYARNIIGEMVLSCLVAASLSYILLDGFNVAAWVQFGAVPFAVAALCVIALYALSYSKRTVRWGVPLYVVALVVLWGVCAVLTPGGGLFVDDGNNLLIPFMCVTLTASCVYVLGRWRLGTALLLLAGVFLLAAIQFFYEGFWVAWDATFLCSATALIVLRNYRASVERATSAEGVSFAAGFVVSVVAALVVAALGAGIWYGVIAPMKPGAVEVKLITKHKALETKLVRGTSAEYQLPDTSLTSDQTNDDERTTDDLKIDQENGRPQGANAKADETETSESAGTSLGVDLDSLDEQFNVLDWVHYFRYALVVALCAVIAVFLAYFLGRRWWRARRLARIQALPPSEQVVALYRFLMSRFARLGMGIAVGQTALEYARANEATMERFETAEGVTFGELTRVYVGVAYGTGGATQEEANRFAAFYQGFWVAARKHLGTIRYLVKSIRL